ncbi:MAG TPA: ABC transporter ATP-binding protein [Polyangiaceae bacterium]|nr:ABC transporter ATP-binding protein [Polyangiaceae bacterium]
MPLLTVRAPAIRYGTGPVVLRDVSLEMHEGESIAVLGGNGAGKTALLSFICGALPAEGGARTLSGTSIRSPRDAVHAGVALVVQNPDDQLLRATVREDVGLGPENLGLSTTEVAKRTESALTTLRLATFADRDVESLSFGEQKRACLAGALAMMPKLLLLDEPTAGLDPAGELEFCDTLRALGETGTGLIAATHAVDLVPRFAKRVLVLGEGRVLADGPCRSVLRDEALLARARLRRPWPAELWARAAVHKATNGDSPMTMEEVLEYLNRK